MWLIQCQRSSRLNRIPEFSTHNARKTRIFTKLFANCNHTVFAGALAGPHERIHALIGQQALAALATTCKHVTTIAQQNLAAVGVCQKPIVVVLQIATMMISFLATLVAVYGSVAEASHVINQKNSNIKADSHIGRALLKSARQLDGGNYQQDDSFLSGYSVKFQGCHHVQQWNDEADDEYDVRIKTKRLVRFRLCPYGDCSTDNSGCTSKYGDYVVDMSTFVGAYLTAKQDDNGQLCQEASDSCSACNGDDNCLSQCYQGIGMSDCLYGNNNQDNDNGFDPLEFAECAQFNMGRRQLDQGNYNNQWDGNYYIGPYCADQGGEIHLGVFTDDTCTSFANGGENMFYNAMGFSMPYSDESLVPMMCVGCGGMNDNGEYEVNEMCEEVYEVAGKCETRMNIAYPNESSCSYIEGIKIIREDGVIRTSAFRKSKAAAVCIGLFLTVAVLLAGYVYYLRTSKFI